MAYFVMEMVKMLGNAHENLFTDEHFMEAVAVINAADNVKDLIDVISSVMSAQMFSYHHFPAIGSVGFKNLSQYYAYNVPQPALDYYDRNIQQRDNPGIIGTFQKGQFIWLSELQFEPYVVEKNFQGACERALAVVGDGINIPLYGPKGRKGYLFITFESVTKDNASILPYKVQALAQIIHTRYCLLTENMQTNAKLTPREAEVLELVSFGKTNIDIGNILQISANTVAVYVKRVFIKLNVSDRVSAAMRFQTIKTKV